MRCTAARGLGIILLISLLAACGSPDSDGGIGRMADATPSDLIESPLVNKPETTPASVVAPKPTLTSSPTATSFNTPDAFAATVTPGTLPTLETIPTPTHASVTPSPQPGAGRPIVGVSEPHMTCDTRQNIRGYGFAPLTTVSILARVPGSAEVAEAGTTQTVADGSFYVVVPAVDLMPWCDAASDVAPPDGEMELNIEVWTVSDANGQPMQAHEPRFIYPVTFGQGIIEQITAQDAMNRVSGYLGGDPKHPGEGFAVEEIEVAQIGLGNGRRYLVTVAAGQDVPPDEFVVDATTGQIVSIYRPQATSHYSPRATREIPDEEALSRAEKWAMETYEGFATLELDTTAVYGGIGGIHGMQGADRIYTAYWRLRDSVSGGWLPTGVTVRINLETDQELSYEAVYAGYNGPTLFLSTDQGDCDTQVDISGYGFIPDTTVHIIARPQGGNGTGPATDPVTVDVDGTLFTSLDLPRFTGCSASGNGAHTERFGITAATLRNPTDPLNGYADPTALIWFSLVDEGSGQ